MTAPTGEAPAPGDAPAAADAGGGHGTGAPAPARAAAKPPGLFWAAGIAVVVIGAASVVLVRSPAPPTRLTPAQTDGDAAGPTASGPTGSGPGAATAGNPLLAQGPSLVGRPVPPFSLEALPLAADGPSDARVSPADFAGKPLVINLWASYCVPCITEMPAFEEVHKGYGDRVGFLGIDVNDFPEDGRSLARRTGVTYPLARDPRGEILVAMGGAGLPTTVVVDRNGIVTRMRTGEWSAVELRAAVDPLLAG